MQCYLVGHFALQVHCQLQHVIVGRPRKQDFARVQLVQSAADRPHVNTIVIRLPYD